MTKSTSSPRVLTAPDYVTEAARAIRAAKTRVVLFTMIITDDSTTSDLINALCETAERGVSVLVAGDIFTLGVLAFETDGHIWKNSGIRATRRMRARLRSSGVTFSWIGQLGPLIYAQRTHLKWCIVDNTVFCFGGVNLYMNGIRSTDYMIELNEKELADRLVKEQYRLRRADQTGKHYRSFSFPCSVGQVHMDGGIFGSSIIYQRACQLASLAQDIVYVSQYKPSGKLADIIVTKNVHLYYNHWQNAFGMNKVLLFVSSLYGRQRTEYKRHPYLHAKFIIFTMPSGQKVAISGTHNFLRGGVVLGTREIALESSDQNLITQLETYFSRYIK